MTNYNINHKRYSTSELIAHAVNQCNDLNIPVWERDLFEFILHWFDQSEQVSIYTSGSTGIPKKIHISKANMVLSASRTLRYFDVKAGENVLLCLPVKYIAGMMMVVRAFVGSLNLITVSPQKLSLHKLSETIDFASMVPLQLANLIDGGENLNNLRKLLLGGAPVAQTLTDKIIIKCKGEVWETYGMTETITHVAVRKIKDEPQLFHAIDGVSFSVDERECLVIHDALLGSDNIITNDRVDLISSTAFRLLGRIDHVINSGGIKIQPEELERLMESYIHGKFCITYLADESLGQMVVLVIEKGEDMDSIKHGIAAMESYQRPKKIFELIEIPALPNGKIDVQAVKKAIGLLLY